MGFYEFHTILHYAQNQDLQGLVFLCIMHNWGLVALSGSGWLCTACMGRGGVLCWVGSFRGSGRLWEAVRGTVGRVVHMRVRVRVCVCVCACGVVGGSGWLCLGSGAVVGSGSAVWLSGVALGLWWHWVGVWWWLSGWGLWQGSQGLADRGLKTTKDSHSPLVHDLLHLKD